jgi:predicted RNase H-like HicB family nuclease
MENKRSYRAYVVLTFLFKQEEDVWTAECKELGTATFGDTYEEAKRDLEEAVMLHLNTLEKVGERERFFKERDIEVFVEQPKTMRFPVMPFDSNVLFSQEVKQLDWELASV